MKQYHLNKLQMSKLILLYSLFHLLNFCYYIYNLPLCKSIHNINKLYDIYNNLAYGHVVYDIVGLLLYCIIVTFYLYLYTYRNNEYLIIIILSIILYPILLALAFIPLNICLQGTITILLLPIQQIINIIMNTSYMSCDTRLCYICFLPFAECIRYLLVRNAKFSIIYNKYNKIPSIVKILFIYIIVISLYVMPIELLINIYNAKWTFIYSQGCFEDSYKRDFISFWGLMLFAMICIFNLTIILVEIIVFKIRLAIVTRKKAN